MGFIKKAFIIGTMVGAFYFGEAYSDWKNENTIERLETQNSQMNTIEYKIASLHTEMANNPKKVEQAVQDYEKMIENPSMIEKILKNYGLKIQN